MPRQRKDDIDRVLISARMDRDLVRAVKQIALDDDVDLYEVYEKAVRQFVGKRRRSRKQREKR